ncbi:MAG: carboxyl transferase domain-containing protein [Peptostreptococcaceae bacterium]|nr:carboxyl transferase domain-containing protein [Peptostreptococcaceae bacterium]
MADKLQQLIEKRQKIEEAGGAKRVQKQHGSGKMTARERMNILFDENTFVELDAFVKHRCTNFDMASLDAPAEGVITGYGKVDGRLVYAFAQDFTVVGGSLGEMHAAKIVKVMDLALKMGAPCVGMNDSGGARIQEAVDALKGYGSIFFRNTISSGVIPQISIIMGPCAGGAVYSPAITDFIFMVENTSQMFITGPQVIKAVTGEVVTAEALGGAITHNTVSGVAHYRSSDDAAAILEVRRLLSFLPSNNLERPPVYETNDDPNRMIEELNSIIPDSPNKAYDVKDIIRSLVDDGDFMEYQELFAPNIVTGYARLNGQTIGIVANQPRVMAGALDINASDKAARFIRTCDSYNIPLLSIEDVPGFLPGTSQEYGGIIRHGAKMLYAFSEATVPKITLITRKAYGGSYIAMCSKELGADMVLAWPTAEIAVMGPDGAANIIFRKDIDASDDPAKTRAEKIEEYKDEFATPYKAAERGYVDDVIEPSHSRIRLIDALDMLRNKKEQRPSKKHGNIPL